jgi:tetratricopeptide (TPR) repeat protein
MAALWSGRLYGFLAAVWLYPSQQRGVKTRKTAARRTVLALGISMLVAAIFAAGWQNRRTDLILSGKAVQGVVAAMVSDAATADWFIADGSVDALVQLEARDRRIDLKVISLAAIDQKAYLRFLGSVHRLADPDWLVATGFAPVFEEWLRGLPDVASSVVVQRDDGFWVKHGKMSLPDLLIYRGVDRDGVAASVDRLMDKIDRTAASAMPMFSDKPWARRANHYLAWAVAHRARMVNDAGVALERIGLVEHAIRAYETARKLQKNQLSATMNLVTLMGAGKAPEDAALREELRAVLDQMPAAFRRWNIASAYGQLNHPGYLVEQGYLWAATGRGEEGIGQMEQGLAASPSDPVAQRILSRMYRAGQRNQQSRELLVSLKKADPGDLAARLELVRLDLVDGRVMEARAGLDELEKKAGPAPEILLARASLMIAEGRTTNAASLFQQVVVQAPDHPAARLSVAIMAEYFGEQEAWVKALSELNRTTGNFIPGLLYLASSARGNRDIAKARGYLHRALRLEPGFEPTLQSLVELEYQAGEDKNLEAALQLLLRVNPGSAIGHYVLASLFARQGRSDLAREALLKSIATRESAAAYNDLAWIEHQSGESESAMLYAIRACELDPGLALSWGTRGKIEFDRGDYPASIQSLERQRSLGGESVDVLLVLAEAYQKNQQPDSARPLLEQVGQWLPQLSDRQRADYERMAHR